jgi:hypothetical protein
MICGTSPLSLESNDKVKNMFIYPNPNDGLANLKIEGHQCPIKTEVYSTFGQLIYSDTFEKSSDGYELNLSKVKAGTYFIKIFANGEHYTEKLIITK